MGSGSLIPSFFPGIQIYPISLRFPIQGPSIDPEELRRQLPVPFRLSEYPLDMPALDLPQGGGASHQIPLWTFQVLCELWGEVLGQKDGI